MIAITRVDHILELPSDILTYILKLLDFKDLRNLMLTGSDFYNLIKEHQSLWKYVTRNELIIENRKDMDLGHPYDQLSRYHAARLSYNWRNGIYQTKQAMKFGKKYMPWISYSPDIFLVTMGSDLRCYNVNEYGMPKTFRPLWKLSVRKPKIVDIRTNDISRFIYRDALLLCGHRDGTANLYKVDNERKKPRLVQHLSKCHEDGKTEVSCVDLYNKPGRQFLVTGSDRCDKLAFYFWPKDDGTFDTIDQNPVKKFKDVAMPGYEGAKSLALNGTGDKVAIGPEGSDKPIFCDVDTMTILAHPKPEVRRDIVKDLNWHDENTVAYVTHTSTLALMDVRIQRIVYEQTDPFYTSMYCVKTDGNNAIVAGSSQYSRCVLYDRRMNAHVQMYFTQKERSPVYCLDFDHLKLVAAIDRGIGVVDFNTFEKTKHRDYSAYVFISDHPP